MFFRFADDVGALLVAAAVQLKARPRNASLQLCWTPVDDVALCVQQAMFTDDERDYVALHCVAGFEKNNFGAISEKKKTNLFVYV